MESTLTWLVVGAGSLIGTIAGCSAGPREGSRFHCEILLFVKTTPVIKPGAAGYTKGVSVGLYGPILASGPEGADINRDVMSLLFALIDVSAKTNPSGETTFAV